MNPNANDANISDQKDDAFIIRWVKALAFALDFGGLCDHIMGWCRFHVSLLFEVESACLPPKNPSTCTTSEPRVSCGLDQARSFEQLVQPGSSWSMATIDNGQWQDGSGNDDDTKVVTTRLMQLLVQAVASKYRFLKQNLHCLAYSFY